MFGFRRNTHFNGVPLHFTEEQNKVWKTTEPIVHYLYSTHPITFIKLVNDMRNDNTNYTGATDAELALDLIKLLENEFIVVERIPTSQDHIYEK